MIYHKKNFSKIFRSAALIISSCTASNLFVQAPTQAMIGRLIQPVVSSTGRVIANMRVANTKLTQGFLHRNTSSSTTSSGGGSGGVRSLIDRFNGNSNTSSPSPLRGSLVKTSTSSTLNPNSNKVSDLIKFYNGDSSSGSGIVKLNQTRITPQETEKPTQPSNINKMNLIRSSLNTMDNVIGTLEKLDTSNLNKDQLIQAISFGERSLNLAILTRNAILNLKKLNPI